MTTDLDSFTKAALDPNYLYIIAANFYTKPGVLFAPNEAGGLSKMPENYKSGLSDESFYAIVEQFAADHDLDIVFQDEGSVVIPSNMEGYQVIQQECGDRFSYMLGDASTVENYVNFQRSEQERHLIMEGLDDDEMHESLYLDS